MNKYSKAMKEKHFAAYIALRYHKTHKNEFLDFNNHPYAKQILIDNSSYQVDIKSTQSGHTEIATVKKLAKAIQGLRIFSVWPNEPLLSQYVKERLNKTIQYTPYYQMVTNTNKKYSTDSTHMKDIGKGNMFLVTSNSDASFTSYPADLVDIEELDECDQDNIKKARERLDHSEYRIQLKRGNPKFVGMGIDAEYAETNQMQWGIRCECGEWVFLNWFEHIIREIGNGQYELRDQDWTLDSGRDIYPICQKCNRHINRKSDGLWIPRYPDRVKVGRHTSKLFAGTVPLYEIKENFDAGLKDDVKMQRVYNADFGMAYTAQGSQITTGMIEACVGNYSPGIEPGVIIAGVDVGKVYNYVIGKLEHYGVKVLSKGTIQDTQELINKLKEYNVKVGIIDGGPETREARKIARSIKLGMLCYFGNVKSDKINNTERTVTVQRTPAIDAVKEAILSNAIQYPINIMSDQEFIDQMTASVRVFNPDRRSGGMVGAYEWVEGNKADHYLLATAYMLIARRLVVLLQRRGKE